MNFVTQLIRRSEFESREMRGTQKCGALEPKNNLAMHTFLDTVAYVRKDFLDLESWSH